MYPPAIKVVGIDISGQMLNRARARADRLRLTNIEALLEMDAANLAWADDSFDAAIAMYVITVVPNPIAAMAEMQRVVKPSGRIFVVSHFDSEEGWSRSIAHSVAPLTRMVVWNSTRNKASLSQPGLRLISDRNVGLGGFYSLLEFEVSGR